MLTHVVAELLLEVRAGHLSKASIQETRVVREEMGLFKCCNLEKMEGFSPQKFTLGFGGHKRFLQRKRKEAERLLGGL